MKRIIFISPKKNRHKDPNYFSYRLKQEVEKKGYLFYKLILSNSIIMSDTQGTLSIISDNMTVDLRDSFIFTRLYGSQKYMLSLIYDLASGYKIPCNDPINSFDTKDQKPTQMIKLSQAGIPYPSSVICTMRSYIANRKTILTHIRFPLVLKAEGERGEAVWKITSQKELENTLSKINSHVILQTYLQNSSDIRILVYKNKILGAIERSSSDGFYNNLSKGGNAKMIQITTQEKQIAKKSAKILDIDFAGVDIIRTKNGPYVIEVNKSPMIKGFEETTHINVVKEIVDYLKKNSL